jgi:hypothetical protein
MEGEAGVTDEADGGGGGVQTPGLLPDGAARPDGEVRLPPGGRGTAVRHRPAPPVSA